MAIGMGRPQQPLRKIVVKNKQYKQETEHACLV